MTKNKYIQTGSDRIFNIVNNIFLILCFVVILFPLLNVISQSISSPGNVLGGKVLFLPKGFSFDGYIKIVKSSNIIKGFYNSFLYTIAGTIISVTLTIMAAYPLSRKSLLGRGTILWLFLFTMIFSGGLIPTYLLVKDLHMIDTRWSLLIPGAVSAWNVIIARTFFMNTIPEELYEAAEIDGSSDIRTLISIVIPLSGPIIAVMVLFYAVGIWNSYFDALIYLSSQNKFPLQLVLRNILISSQLQSQLLANSTGDQSKSLADTEVLKYAVIVFSSLPVLLLYPFIQKHFVKGIMIGSMKG